MKNAVKTCLDINSVILQLEFVKSQLLIDKVEIPNGINESINKLYKIRNEIYPIYNYDGRD